MKETLLPLLQCPVCQGPLLLDTVDERDDAEILSATLSCEGCSCSYPVRSGIPRLLTTDNHVEHVAESFGFEWELHHRGGFEKDTVFGLTIDEDVESFFKGLAITSDDLDGCVVIDAGCGSGTLTVEIAKRHPEAQVIGMDINPAIAYVYEQARRLPNLHLVQGSAFEPPFDEETFDFIWCNGVIHHSGDTRRAFDALSSKTKRGGRAYFWVYEKKFSPLVGLRKVLLPLRVTDWNHRVLYRFCQVISVPTLLAVKAMAPLRRIPGIRDRTTLSVLVRDRGYSELALTWFDVLSPKYRDTYTTEEFRAWFEENGFDDINEYWWPVGISGKRT